jgi:lysosomal acid lipase/cholesteryl ester hydrolase
MDTSMPAWFDERFPPLSIYHGGRDYLVRADPLLERLQEKEKTVKVIRTKRVEQSEHCDFYWAADAVEWLFEDLVGELSQKWQCRSDELTRHMRYRGYRDDPPQGGG